MPNGSALTEREVQPDREKVSGADGSEPEALPASDLKWIAPCAWIGALVFAVALFALIALAQLGAPPEPSEMTVRETAVVPIEPPEPPAAEEPPPPPPTEPPPPPPAAPPPLPIRPLDVALSPGGGDAIAMGPPQPELEGSEDPSADLGRLFSFSDLSETPRLLSQPRWRFPPELARRGVERGEAVVRIVIRPDGTAEFVKIVSSSRPEFEPVARRIVEQARFTKPLVDGEPKQVLGDFPLVFER